jgi:hypothetical protein
MTGESGGPVTKEGITLKRPEVRAPGTLNPSDALDSDESQWKSGAVVPHSKTWRKFERATELSMRCRSSDIEAA